MTEITFVRHTEVSNPDGLCYGRYDISLHDTYQRELEAIRNQLGASQFTKVISSPAARCKTLAHDLSRSVVCIDPRLQEMNFGSWEGKPWSSLPMEETMAFANDVETYTPPLGESYTDMAERLGQFFNDLKLMKEPQDKILVTTHKGPLWTILARQLELSLKACLSIQIPYGAIYRVRILDSPSSIHP